MVQDVLKVLNRKCFRKFETFLSIPGIFFWSTRLALFHVVGVGVSSLRMYFVSSSLSAAKCFAKRPNPPNVSLTAIVMVALVLEFHKQVVHTTAAHFGSTRLGVLLSNQQPIQPKPAMFGFSSVQSTIVHSRQHRLCRPSRPIHCQERLDETKSRRT